MADFEVMVSCHNFQKRLCWLLSSLIGQGPSIKVSIACVSGNGMPSTSDVIRTFSDRIEIDQVDYQSTDEFQYRGYVRNRQVVSSSADWLLFTDSDMVFPRRWFSDFLELSDKPTETCLHVGRYSTILNETNALIDSFDYPSIIGNPFEMASKLPSKLMPAVGAGYCQLIDGDYMRRRGSYILGKSKDWSWERYSKCVSDVQFRRSLPGGRKELPLKRLIHLQHERDSEHNRHIGIQR